MPEINGVIIQLTFFFFKVSSEINGAITQLLKFLPTDRQIVVRVLSLRLLHSKLRNHLEMKNQGS